MSASLSPEQYSSHQSQSPGDGSEGKSPAALNLDFFKNLNDKRSNRGMQSAVYREDPEISC